MAQRPISKREQRRRLRERAKFWDRYGERLRVAAIAIVAIIGMIVVMKAFMT